MSSHYTCELSGELLSPADDAVDAAVVVTPSGHICSRRFLLQKLSETAGQDPFDPTRTITEDDLIVLKKKNKNASSAAVVPPRTTTTTTTMAGMLSQFQTEYCAVLAELVDTRTALQQTRQELSAALYQNDAAVRVVARLAAERDAARATATATASAETTTADIMPTSNKKRRLEETETTTTTNELLLLPLTNDIPASDMQIMLDTWQTQHESRKAVLKQATFMTADELRLNFGNKEEDDKEESTTTTTTSPAWHKTSCRGITAMAAFQDKFLLTAGKDKHLMIYDTYNQQVVVNISARAAATAVDLQGGDNNNNNDNDLLVLAGYASGTVNVYANDNLLGTIEQQDNSSAIQHVQWHPSGQHFVVASESGCITIGRVVASTSSSDDANHQQQVQAIAVLKPTTAQVKLTAGALHPDGLIYIAATAFGELLVWDLKQKSVASTLLAQQQDSSSASASSKEKNPVTAVAISPNGYHIAAVYAKSNTVKIWDLRKQKVLAVLNSGSEGAGGDATATPHLESIQSVTFDPAGKYVAYGGPSGIHIVTVKEWNTVTAVLKCPTKMTADSLLWLPNQLLAACSKKNRKVCVFGKKKEE